VSVVAPLARWTTILYLLGVTAMFARMFLGLAGARRLRRDATPLAHADLLEAVRRHAQRLQLRHVPTVAYCRRVAVPALVGLWRPMILLPTVLATGLTPEQLELVVVHEMAHIRRWDNAWIVVQRAIESILFFHPAVWYVSRRLSIERELCCDEMVVAMAAHRSEYAASLLRVAELTATGPAAVPVGANMTSPREGSAVFVHRLMRILGEAKSSPVRLLRFWPTLTVVLLIIVTLCVVRLNAYAKRATAAEMVLARSLVDKKLLLVHWEGLEPTRDFSPAVTEIFSTLSNMEPNPQIFNPARTDSPQLDPVGQVLLDRLAPGEDEVFQRTDSGALRYLKRIRVEKSCPYCHVSRGSVFDSSEGRRPENRLRVGDVLAVVSLEIPADR
jgi:beta-lactamase regulating signal transducer with metallopeptidase domain